VRLNGILWDHCPVMLDLASALSTWKGNEYPKTLSKSYFTRMWCFDKIEIAQFLLVLNSLDCNYDPL